MHIKHIHETIERLSQYACEEACKNKESINTEEMGEVVDMVKDLAEAEYYARIAKAMEESDKEEGEEAKYIMKKMKEEYGEEEGERRFYDDYRYKRSGRFAPKGKGSYMPIRGYEQPMGYGMMPEIYNPMEWDRDMDRMNGRMYFPNGGNSGGQSGQSSGGSSSGMSGNMGGNTRGYEEGYSDGNRRGYEEGYSAGQRNGKGTESRYDKAKRGYEEAKQAHKGNTPEDKQLTMKETEKMINVVLDEIDEMLEGASPEVKSLVKTKGMARLQKIQ